MKMIVNKQYLEGNWILRLLIFPCLFFGPYNSFSQAPSEQYTIDFRFLIEQKGSCSFKGHNGVVFSKLNYIGELTLKNKRKYYLITQSQVINPHSLRTNHRLWVVDDIKTLGYYYFDMVEYLPVATDGMKEILFVDDFKFKIDNELPKCIYGPNDSGCFTKKQLSF
ncbi:MAG: hypothetical protein AAFP92_07615 [Bacteroidota bacterium]